MKDYAHSTGEFKKWKNNETSRQLFLGELMEAIKKSSAYPFGCAIPMDYFRNHPTYLQDSIKDPYYIAFMICSIIMSFWAEPFRNFGESIAPVFAEQTEFQSMAMKMYQGLRKNNSISDLIDSPIFRPMEKLVPLQAADFVAYEMQKEIYRRLYIPERKARWGWTQLQYLLKNNQSSGFIFPSEQNVADMMKGIKKGIEYKLIGRYSE
jgi:hypothetical protein